MRTLKTILIMSMLMVFATSCTDLTEDLAPNTEDTVELIDIKANTGKDENTKDGTGSQDTGGDGGNDTGSDNGKDG